MGGISPKSKSGYGCVAKVAAAAAVYTRFSYIVWPQPFDF